MSLAYQLNNADNWEQVYSTSVTAEPVPNFPDRYYRIPEIIAPFTIDSHVIAVYCTSSEANPKWRLGALMNVRISTGILVGGEPDTYPVEKKKIWLNRITLFTLERLTPEFAVSFDIPYWLRQISLSVYKYTGPIVDSVETKLNTIQSDLTALTEEFRQFAGSPPQN